MSKHGFDPMGLLEAEAEDERAWRRYGDLRAWAVWELCLVLGQVSVLVMVRRMRGEP